MAAPRAVCSAKRPLPSRAVAMAEPSAAGEKPIGEALRDLLHFLAFWDRDDAGDNDDAAPGAREGSRQPMRAVLGDDGLLGWLRFAKENEPAARESVTYLRSAGDVPSFLERIENVRRDWARRLGLGGGDAGVEPVVEERGSVLLGDSSLFGAVDARSLRRTILYVGEAVCPWDYDRKEASLTFVNVWTDVETVPGDSKSTKVKLASTINPLRQTWKLTARTRLFNLTGGSIGGGESGNGGGGGGDDGAGGATGGVVFGKAGIYLVGDTDPYIGVESDRVVNVPYIPGTSVFANANYRSSRKPTIVASVGLQQTVNIGDGLALTLRAGINSHDGPRRPFVTPVPFGSYF